MRWRQRHCSKPPALLFKEAAQNEGRRRTTTGDGRSNLGTALQADTGRFCAVKSLNPYSVSGRKVPPDLEPAGPVNWSGIDNIQW